MDIGSRNQSLDVGESSAETAAHHGANGIFDYPMDIGSRHQSLDVGESSA
jgi:hypothetical protein